MTLSLIDVKILFRTPTVIIMRADEVHRKLKLKKSGEIKDA